MRGYSLVEAVIYISILTVFVLLVFSGAIFIGQSYRRVKATAAVERSALSTLDRIVREVQLATRVNVAQSVIGSSPGRLVLEKSDGSGGQMIVEFFVLGTTLRLKEAGVDVGPITEPKVEVETLFFRLSSTTISTIVKIEMTLKRTIGTESKTQNFFTSAVLRNS